MLGFMDSPMVKDVIVGNIQMALAQIRIFLPFLCVIGQ
jgi:hypothetical protein